MNPFVLLVTLLLFVASPLLAETIHVPDDHETIQGAIDASADGDIILVEPGVYVENINFVGKLVTVASRFFDTGDQAHISSTVIDGNAAGRAVIIRNGENEQARLIGFTIRNGRYAYGGGIYLSGTTPTLSNLIIHGNVATNNGGGIYATQGASPTIDRVTIYGNSGEQFGAINCYNEASAMMTNSIIWGNSPAGLPETLDLSYSCNEPNKAGQGNFDDDPQFLDPEEDDFGLNRGSPCIDTGDPDAEPDPDGTRRDVGALSFTHFPSIMVTPEALNFGSIRLNQQVDGTVRIINSGEIPLNIEDITIPDNDAPFAILEGEAAELAPGDTIVVEVRFSPREPGDYSDTLMVTSDDPDDADIFIDLVGTGLQPAPEIEVDPMAIDFGGIALRDEAQMPVTIRNAGDALLSISRMAIEGADADLFGIEFNGEFSIASGEEIALPVSFEPAALNSAEALLTIESNDGDEAAIQVALNARGVLPEQRYQFAANTGVNHSILILDAANDGEPFALGSEIGLFSENDLCCGGGFWLEARLGLAAWGDNEMTEDIDGLVDGEAFSFRIWDIETGEERYPDIEFVEGDEVFNANGVTVIRLSISAAPDGFKMFIGNTWSLLSAPVSPPTTNVIELWVPVVERGHLVMVKERSGRFYLAERGFSNMPPWDFRQGYQVKGNAIDSLDMGGDYVPVDTEIPLVEGWNFISYFPEASLTPQIAFANIANRITIAKDGFGRFYLPAIGFNNMAPLRRGLGYQVRATEVMNLVWNVPERRMASATITKPPVHFPQPRPGMSSMSLLISGDIGGNDVEIAAFGLDDLLLGSERLDGEGPWGMAIWNDDPTTVLKEGAGEGEAIRLVVWRNGTLEPLSALWSRPATFAADELAIVKVEPLSPLPVTLSITGASPNPFNSKTILSWALPSEASMRLGVYDLSGRLVENLVDGRVAAGNHRTVWNAEGVPAGLYIVRLEAEGRSFTSKLTLLR